MSYIIAMKFISWIIAIWMLIGFATIKVIENILFNSMNVNEIALTKTIMEDYYNRNFAGKVLLILFFGAKAMALPFNLRGKHK